MAKINPLKIPGRWHDGYALDLHTLKSVFLGNDEFGRPLFETTRSEIGELLYRLKYSADQTAIPELVQAAVGFIVGWKASPDALVPVPPSRARAVQPVLVLAKAMADDLKIEFVGDGVTRTKEIPELKNVYDYDERLRILADAHAVSGDKTRGKRILLFDDLYRSGATMNQIAKLLYDAGGASEVLALALTRTRSAT